MFLTVIAACLVAVLIFIFAMVYRELSKQDTSAAGMGLTTFIIISQIIIFVEIVLSHLNII